MTTAGSCPHDIPDLPGGWLVASNKQNLVSLLHPDTGRSLELHPTTRRGCDGWTVMGLAGYGPDCPVFVDDEPLETALEVAVAEATARLDGESLDPIRTAGERAGEPDSGSEDGNSGDRSDDDNSLEGQTSLAAWGE